MKGREAEKMLYLIGSGDGREEAPTRWIFGLILGVLSFFTFFGYVTLGEAPSVLRSACVVGALWFLWLLAFVRYGRNPPPGAVLVSSWEEIKGD